MPDLFKTLVQCAVAQQIYRKAADTVYANLCGSLRDITPRTVANTDVSDIQKCGLPMRKARYIKEIGEAAVSGDLDLLKLREMPDEGVIEKLSSLPDIGVWTDEMLLIFSLCRPDVVSWGDLAIRRGMMNLYGLKELSKKNLTGSAKGTPLAVQLHLYTYRLCRLCGPDERPSEKCKWWTNHHFVLFAKGSNKD